MFNALDKFGTFGSRLIPEQLASLFTTDAAVIAEAARYLRIAACSQLFLCAEVVLESAIGGAGWTLPPMLGSTAILTILRPTRIRVRSVPGPGAVRLVAGGGTNGAYFY